MHKSKKFRSRREFLKLSSLATLGLATPFSALTRMKSINNVLSSSSFPDYKAIVLLFLHGGNDSYNMLMPKTGNPYTDYQNTRSNLALDSANMLGIDADVFGLHPSIPGMHQMYNDNELAFMANTGALVEPTTVQNYIDGNTSLPLGLFSHLDQFNHFQTALPDMRTNIGWAGKIADLLAGQNGNQSIPMNVSLSGSNIFQYGINDAEFSMNNSGPVMPTYWDETWGDNPERRAGLDSLVHTSHSDMYMSTYTNIFKNAIEAGQEFQAALENAYNFTTAFSSHSLSQSFEMIAKTISVQNNLDFQRQIFFVKFHGWDHHDDLLSNHSNYLGIVNNALSEFNSALKEINHFDDVTTVVASEFARKLTSNGNGTDHAWGGNLSLMGGAVNGGSIYGNYPGLGLVDNPSLIHNGTLIPDTPIDSMFAEIAMWYGINVSDLPTLFPNLGNFHDVPALSSANPPIGFMQLT